MTQSKVIRCAIYTRKSTEEGLEQAFNSLDAQREACAAYVTSQRHEGWVLSPEMYDDGGFSGGNMNRPGLSQLMAEVEAGCIHVIVVYKVDRLTRSLADFAKIVEVLDKAGASFVSVTQSFNTTTSMGRLTLNVLLSFAQFEREVTGERIRDKIAASKRKGMWMGGPVPLGYDVQDRKLVVNQTEAETVRLIFDRYLQLGSVVATVESLDRDGVKTKLFAGEGKKRRGGIAWTRGGLAHLLVNRIYIGQIRHKNEHFPGEHDAIIAPEVWDAVQAQLAGNGVARKHDQILRHANLLGGLMFDGLGRRMKSSQAAKGAKRYHYYVTAVDAVVKAPGAAWRVPAHDTEALIVNRVHAFLRDRRAVQDAVEATADPDARALEAILSRAQYLSLELAASPLTLRSIVRRVDLKDDHVDVLISLQPLLPMIGDLAISVASTDAAEAVSHLLSAPIVKLRRGPEVRLVIAEPQSNEQTVADPALIRLLATARAANAAMHAAKDQSVAEAAKALGYTNNYFTLLLRLATLAPSIVQAIIEGRQPPSLTRQRLAKITNLPLDWNEQRRLLGFA
ncbi:recombinase family protein [Sandarakinorhabdus sp.]|jgi:site-specific DNA recombinase|uniref:recombinase family protein n=1 Tax=Sandarakinorhabdus sp. TaxID=1916663 RepID=UPI0028A69FBC|nr:recombinase family protein [Sandarakinorhabdus sp.]